MTSDSSYEDPRSSLVSRHLQLADLAESLSHELRRIANLSSDSADLSTSWRHAVEAGALSRDANGLEREDPVAAKLQKRLAESEDRVQEVSTRIATLTHDLDLRRIENRTVEASLHHTEFELTDTAARLATARLEIERRDLVLSAMRRRLSWRLGAPLRALHRAYLRIRELYRPPAPNPLFDEAFYLENYPDVREYGIDPYRHYIRYGAFEARNPNPMFDSKWYLDQNADVRRRSMNPLIHYFKYGAAEGRDPHPLFSTKWYLAQLPKGEAKGINALEHYLGLLKRPETP